VTESRGASGDQRAGRASGPSQFRRTYPAQPESVGAVRSALVAFVRAGGLGERIADAVALAASEAATNVVMHAYGDGHPRGEIEVTAAVAGDELWVIVTDAGSGLQPHRDSPGLGLGLAIIARVADAVDLVKPAAGGLEVRMRFAVASGVA
jgi:anti-sigma regulatory factor (Ser/Thr protein kinase)